MLYTIVVKIKHFCFAKLPFLLTVEYHITMHILLIKLVKFWNNISVCTGIKNNKSNFKEFIYLKTPCCSIKYAILFS